MCERGRGDGARYKLVFFAVAYLFCLLGAVSVPYAAPCGASVPQRVRYLLAQQTRLQRAAPCNQSTCPSSAG